MKDKRCAACLKPVTNTRSWCFDCRCIRQEIFRREDALEMAKLWAEIGRGIEKERHQWIEKAEDDLDAILEKAEKLWGRQKLISLGSL